MLNLFASDDAEQVLLYLQHYGRGNPAQIARTFNIWENKVWMQLRKFERDGVVVSGIAGDEHVFEINPECLFKAELGQLLEKAIEMLPEAQQKKWFTRRRALRQSGADKEVGRQFTREGCR